MNRLTLLTCIATSVLASQSFAQWNLLAPANSPSPRFKPAIAHDLARGQTVLFGGGSMFGFFGDTWVYDGDDWVQLSPAVSPSGRADARMAHDAARSVTYLYGGNAGGGPWGGPASDETWSWDGQTWTQLQPAVTPGGRARYGAAFDSARGRMVIYGGLDNLAFPIASADTWEFDGSNWALVTTATGPGPREAVAMCYDTTNRRTLMFGGLDPQVGGFADTWAFDGTTWTRLATNGSPSARTGAEMVFDSARGVALLQGGSDPNTGATIDETWEFDGSSWTLIGSGAPADHAQFAMVYDPRRQNTLLFGGIDSSFGFWNDTWEYGASFHAYGAGCSGPLASPAIANATGPILGATFQVAMTGLDPASTGAFLLFGFGRTTIDLSSVGMPGCVLHAAADLIFPVAAGAGAASWALPVPNSAALVGAKFYCQGLAPDASANALGLVVSAAAESVIGR
jgi:hypothetical protein